MSDTGWQPSGRSLITTEYHHYKSGDRTGRGLMGVLIGTLLLPGIGTVVGAAAGAGSVDEYDQKRSLFGKIIKSVPIGPDDLPKLGDKIDTKATLTVHCPNGCEQLASYKPTDLPAGIHYKECSACSEKWVIYFSKDSMLLVGDWEWTEWEKIKND